MNEITSMRQAAIELSALGTRQAIVWQKIQDIVIEVFVADAATVEYTAKAGDEIFITENISEFVNVLEYALN